MPTIALEKATKLYKVERRRKEAAVSEVDLTIRQGEFVFLIGSSGAGKSTLLRLMAGEIRPERGKATLDGRDLTWLMRWSRANTTLQFGRVWQAHTHTLIHRQTVEENLALAARIGGRNETSRQLQERVRKVLGLVGIPESRRRYPVELSLGECRRVELARALINSPPILLLDEITANLDDDNIWDILQFLNEINEKGTTVVMATHASQYVNIMRKRVVTLVDGRVYADIKKGKYGEVTRQNTYKNNAIY